MKTETKTPKEKLFTPYQVFIIAILATLQFTIILDFMVLSPLGAILMDKLKVSTAQFGLVVSAYAFSAGVSGLLAAGFADKFDRKKLLLFFYGGFVLGTLLCAIAPNYHMLLIARIVTGIFGGVIGAISYAIITDLFKMEVRGRVMGFVQMAFAASQILGLPLGLLLATHLGWHSPFWMIAAFAALVGVAIIIYMKPITGHLHIKSDRNPLQHLLKTLSKPNHLWAFFCTSLLATGGFMLMPFGSAFGLHNMGITLDQLTILYFVTGVSSIIFGPQIGKLSDKLGKYKVFIMGSLVSLVSVLIYTRLGITPLWVAIALNVVMFIGITARMISFSALTTAVPDPQDRGAFMSINSAVQQIAGGIGATIAGMIIVQNASGFIKHYDTLGVVVGSSMIIGIGLMYIVNKIVQDKQAANAAAAPMVQPIAEPAIEVAAEI